MVAIHPTAIRKTGGREMEFMGIPPSSSSLVEYPQNPCLGQLTFNDAVRQVNLPARNRTLELTQRPAHILGYTTPAGRSCAER